MRVLIAEDSVSGRIVLKRTVERLGHECRVAVDGEDAWSLFQEHGADVIISDWMMPKLEGPELCARVRAQGSEPYVYFAFLTVLDDKQHALEGIRPGADGYLPKPLDPLDLQTCLIAAERVTSLHRTLAQANLRLTENATRELGRANRALYESARTDALTSLNNRLRLQEDLLTMYSRAIRYGQRYSVVMLDLDRFKAYNDRYGHLRADTVLQKVAQVIKLTCRDGDSAYRYGGEEIVVVSPEQNDDGAFRAADRFRCAVEALGIEHLGNPPTGPSRSARGNGHGHGRRSR